MLYLHAWHLGSLRQTLSESLASVYPIAGRRWGEWKPSMEERSRNLGLRPPALLTNTLCMLLGKWDMACIHEDTQDFCRCVGRTRIPTNSSLFSCVTRKTRVLVPLVSILAQHPVFRGPSMSIIPKHVQHKGKAPEQVPTQPRKEH